MLQIAFQIKYIQITDKSIGVFVDFFDSVERPKEKKKPHEALKRLQRVKVAMADPDAAGQTPWYRFPVNEPRRQRLAAHSSC